MNYFEEKYPNGRTYKYNYNYKEKITAIILILRDDVFLKWSLIKETADLSLS